MKFKIILCFLLSFSGYAYQANAQVQHDEAIAKADSSSFAINKTGGWKLFNSYMAKIIPDSVQFELIIQHANNINWREEQYIGRVKKRSLSPKAGKMLFFSLINCTYRLRVDDDGKCYIKLEAGVLPINDPVILPFKVFYKL